VNPRIRAAIWGWLALAFVGAIILRWTRTSNEERAGDVRPSVPIKEPIRPETFVGKVEPRFVRSTVLEWWGDPGAGPTVVARWLPDREGNFGGRIPQIKRAGLVVRREGRIVAWVPDYALESASGRTFGADPGVRVEVPLQTVDGPGIGLRFRVSLLMQGVGWIPWGTKDTSEISSDASGILTIRSLPQGAAVHLELLDRGYANAPILTMFGAGIERVRRLAPVRLDRAGEIVGRLRDESGRPGVGVGVRLRKVAAFLDDARTTTDKAGVFRFVSIRPGTYGIVPAYWGSGGNRRAASVVEPINVESGRTIEVGVMRGAPVGVLFGRAISAREGTGVAGVTLRAHRIEGGPDWVAEVATDSQGRFEIAVPRGRWRVVGSRFDAFLGEVSRIRVEPGGVDVVPGSRVPMRVRVGTSVRNRP